MGLHITEMVVDTVIRIDSEFKDLIPPLSAEEYSGLEESIIREGCRDALILWGETLIDGHNRYEICQKHNIPFQTVQMDFDSRNDVIVWMIRNQLGRRNLPAYESARLALRLKPELAEIAKKNQSKYYGNQHESGLSLKLAKEQRLDTREEIAKAAGVSHGTLSKVEKIEQKAAPEIKQQLRTGEMSINQAYQLVRRAEKESSREEQRQENAQKVEKLATPLDAQGLFQTIVIDPPWDWGDEGDADQFGRARPDYSTMSIDEIEKLPVGKISDTNCHIYLWVTNRSLPKAFRLLEAWGFRYITCLTWVKPNIGMGNYFRGDTEQVLFGVKGSQPLKRRDVGTHFEAPRGKGHSAKPDDFYSLVESCSYGPYIDIFGRKDRDGWSVWGENG